jgi:hypothetical protein
MPITLIRNSTGAQLTLLDVRTPLANLPDGASAQQVPITITSVTRGGVAFSNRQGGFMNNDSYVATFVAPATVSFTGNTGTVNFT